MTPSPCQFFGRSDWEWDMSAFKCQPALTAQFSTPLCILESYQLSANRTFRPPFRFLVFEMRGTGDILAARLRGINRVLAAVMVNRR